MNDQHDNEQTDKEALEKHGEKPTGVSTLNPIAKEYMVAILHKLPHTSEEELRGAQFPEEIVEEWKRVWNRPPIGKVHAATAREYRSNCSLIEFESADQLNKWFEKNNGYILFDWKVVSEAAFIDRNWPVTKIVALIGQILSPEDQADIEIRATVINEEVEKRKKERVERIEEHAQQIRKQQDENRRLLELGKRCEANHGAVLKDRKKGKVK